MKLTKLKFRRKSISSDQSGLSYIELQVFITIELLKEACSKVTVIISVILVLQSLGESARSIVRKVNGSESGWPLKRTLSKVDGLESGRYDVSQRLSQMLTVF